MKTRRMRHPLGFCRGPIVMWCEALYVVLDRMKTMEMEGGPSAHDSDQKPHPHKPRVGHA